jgi:hypothetical protein
LGFALFHGSKVVAQLATQISTETEGASSKNKFEILLTVRHHLCHKRCCVAKAIDSLCDPHRDESQREKQRLVRKTEKWTQSGETEK